MSHQLCLQSFDKNELGIKSYFSELANNKDFLA